jgi:hypothetical protein
MPPEDQKRMSLDKGSSYAYVYLVATYLNGQG